MHWASGTAHLLPRLLRGRDHGPVFLSQRRPGPARRPPQRDLCPHTGKARLGYDRARILRATYTGWELHPLRHSAATISFNAGVSLETIRRRLGHANAQTVLRYADQRDATIDAEIRSWRRRKTTGHPGGQPPGCPGSTRSRPSGWSKKQQMRWSPTGAQLFLQVRTAVLNNDLAGCFRRWYPGFTHAGGPAEIEIDVAA